LFVHDGAEGDGVHRFCPLAGGEWRKHGWSREGSPGLHEAAKEGWIPPRSPSEGARADGSALRQAGTGLQSFTNNATACRLDWAATILARAALGHLLRRWHQAAEAGRGRIHLRKDQFAGACNGGRGLKWACRAVAKGIAHDVRNISGMIRVPGL
jgi:hypothetical protein